MTSRSDCDLCGEPADPPVLVEVVETRGAEIGTICVECVEDLYHYLHPEFDDGDDAAEYITDDRGTNETPEESQTVGTPPVPDPEDIPENAPPGGTGLVGDDHECWVEYEFLGDDYDTVEQRVSRFISYLEPRYEGGDLGDRGVPVSKLRDLAPLVNATAEEVSDALDDLRRRGVVYEPVNGRVCSV